MARIVTMRALARTLKELMLEKPFAKITTEELCERTCISKRNFYRYFSDKYELLGWIYEDEFFSRLTEHPDWTIWDYFPSVCEYCYSNREFFRRAVQIEGQNSPRAYWKKSLIPLIHRDFAGSAFDDAVVDFYIERETDALFDYMQLWIKNEPCMPPDEFAAQVRSSVCNHARHVAEIAGRKPPDSN